MKFTAVLLTTIAAVMLQVTLARYTVGGSWVFDLVLVGAVFAGLQWGPAAGLLSGTIGGLLQDLLSGGIVGVNGLTKTLVGFAAGLIGTQFVLTRAHARSIIVAGATFVHRGMMLGLTGLIEQHWPGVSWGTMLGEVALNTLAAFVLFQATSAWPGMIERHRASRRTSFSRRQW